ncbi:hypothetical protein ACGYJ8_17145 [Sulfitobacter sp. 1A12126]|uniref:hypothetical protein n=1 Tax=Sulfitobacter sp. 1A12126 TaxID=3368591 RepID=UPI003745F4B3
MIVNDERKFAFIEVPKTGTSTIAKCLLQIDPGCRRNRLIGLDGRAVEVPVHATVSDVRRLLGSDAEQYTFVAFLRDPVEVMVSKYHFYRTGRAAQRSASERGDIGRKMRVAFARSLPIVAWCALYPFKSSAHFVLDEGTLAVDLLGDFADIQTEVVRIFGRFGYEADQLALTFENRTGYSRPSSPVYRWLQIIASIKLRQDFQLYEAARNKSRASLPANN